MAEAHADYTDAQAGWLPRCHLEPPNPERLGQGGSTFRVSCAGRPRRSSAHRRRNRFLHYGFPRKSHHIGVKSPNATTGPTREHMVRISRWHPFGLDEPARHYPSAVQAVHRGSMGQCDFQGPPVHDKTQTESSRSWPPVSLFEPDQTLHLVFRPRSHLARRGTRKQNCTVLFRRMFVRPGTFDRPRI